MKGSRPHRRAAAGIALGVVLFALAASLVADEPVRRLLERRTNAALRGYRLEIGELDLRPFSLGFDVRDLVLTRSDGADSPVARFARLTATVEWRALLRGAVVADVELDRPRVTVDRNHVEREAEDELPLAERGWQDAVRALIPLEIDEVRVHDGELTYLERGAREPLRVAGMEARASNIRNIHSRDREYPSELALDATVFDAGRLRLRGRADFLAEPLPGVTGELALEEIELGHLKPVLERHHFAVRGGRLTLSGEVELGRTIRRVHLRELRVEGLVGDYVRTQASAAKEPEVARQAARATREAMRDPELRLRADRVELRDADVGMVSRTTERPYRVFLSHAQLALEGFSNRFREGSGRARLSGRFMGSGFTEARATFRPERSGPNFDLEVRIVDTPLEAMNELLRAHGRVDAAGGLFSLYAEARVEDGRIEGYVKPLFREVRLHDPAQDRRDGLARRAWEGVVGGVAELLENRARDEIVTQTRLSGPLEDPDASSWQLLAKLVENAFFRSVLPGLDREALRARQAAGFDSSSMR